MLWRSQVQVLDATFFPFYFRFSYYIYVHTEILITFNPALEKYLEPLQLFQISPHFLCSLTIQNQILNTLLHAVQDLFQKKCTVLSPSPRLWIEEIVIQVILDSPSNINLNHPFSLQKIVTIQLSISNLSRFKFRKCRLQLLFTLSHLFKTNQNTPQKVQRRSTPKPRLNSDFKSKPITMGFPPKKNHTFFLRSLFHGLFFFPLIAASALNCRLENQKKSVNLKSSPEVRSEIKVEVGIQVLVKGGLSLKVYQRYLPSQLCYINIRMSNSTHIPILLLIQLIPLIQFIFPNTCYM